MENTKVAYTVPVSLGTQATKPVDPIVEPVETGLAKVELGTELIPTLREGYRAFYDDAQKLIEDAQGIVVKDESDSAGMESARKTRLALVKVRTGADKKRKEMKAEALRYGKAVDGMYNVLEAWTVPVENNLYEKERFAEIKKLERQMQLREQRHAELLPYKDFAPSGIDLGILDEEAYSKVLTGARLSYEAHVKAEAIRVEQERIAKEEAEAKAKAEEERKAKELEEARVKAKEAEAKAEAERKAREKERAESDARAKADAERIRRANEELEAKQKQVNVMAETMAKQSMSAPIPATRVAGDMFVPQAMPSVKDSVDFMKSHGDIADSEKWDNMISILTDQTKLTFKLDSNKKTYEAVVPYLHKLIKYINDRK